MFSRLTGQIRSRLVGRTGSRRGLPSRNVDGFQVFSHLSDLNGVESTLLSIQIEIEGKGGEGLRSVSILVHRMMMKRIGRWMCFFWVRAGGTVEVSQKDFGR